jgi:alpha-L-fucosidase
MAAEEQGWDWFEQARFGLFVHWGIYSLLERGEQSLFRERLNPIEYERLARRFRPALFDADEWIGSAKEAGMRYAVLTTKHHDGFCLFDSAVSDYTAVKTAARRDFIAEYTAACRRHGLKVGLYYSLADWHWPAYFSGPKKTPEEFARFLDYTHTQIKELCTNYGQIDVLWFDGGWPWSAEDWKSEEIDRMIRELQPYVMINDRLHGGGGGNVKPKKGAPEKTRGYFDTAEQRAPGQSSKRPIETCRTSVSRWWGYSAGDRLWKSPAEIIFYLTGAAEAGANFLLNVGPKSDGTFPEPFRQILRETGRWLMDNGEAIYGTQPGVCDCMSWGRMTTREGRAYLHVLYWPGKELNLYGLENEVTSAYLLASKKPLSWVQEGAHLLLRGLPARPPDPLGTVIVLEVEGTPRQHPEVVRLWQENADTSSLADWAAGR